MSSNESDITDEIDVEELKERVEDLEVRVYGHDRSSDLSAGEVAAVNLKQTVVFVERQTTHPDDTDPGAPVETVIDVAEALGMDRELADQALEKLRRQGEVYEPQTGAVKAT